MGVVWSSELSFLSRACDLKENTPSIPTPIHPRPEVPCLSSMNRDRNSLVRYEPQIKLSPDNDSVSTLPLEEAWEVNFCV